MGCNGCTSTCGCNIIGDGVTAEVVRSMDGETFTVSAIIPIRSASDTPCIALDVDPDTGDLTATPIIDSDPGSITLECGPDGLRGDVRIDPDSSAELTITTGGLRVDVPTVDLTGVFPIGTVIENEGWQMPADFADAYGQEDLVSSFPELYDWLTLVTTTATVNSGSAIISDLPSTVGMYAGLDIQAFGWGAAETIASVDSPTQITLSSPASASFAGNAEVRAFKDGLAPSGDSYFLFPDHRDMVIAGLGNMGGTARNYLDADGITGSINKRFGGLFGQGDVQLSVSELALHDHVASVTDPGHSHGITDPGHAHTGTADSGGGHTHGAGTASDRSYVTTDTLTPTTAGVTTAGADDIILEVGLEATPRQTNNQATSPGGTHGHSLSINNAATGVTVGGASTGITVDVQDEGGTDAHLNMQPTRYVRKIIKVR